MWAAQGLVGLIAVSCGPPEDHDLQLEQESSGLRYVNVDPPPSTS